MSSTCPLQIDVPTVGNKADLKAIWLPFLLSRLWIAIFLYLGHSCLRPGETAPAGWTGVRNPWLSPWTHFDSMQYLRIATVGYRPVTVGYFPLYPLLLKLAGGNETAQALWGIIISNLCFFFALLLLLKVARRDYDERVARRAVWILAFFPVSVIFSAVFSESLFLVTLLACFYNIRRRRWDLACAWVLLAALTRNSGAVLGVAIACELFRAIRERGWATTPRFQRGCAFFCPIVPLLALLAVEVYFAHRFSDPLIGLKVHKLFGRQVYWPGQSLLLDILFVVSQHNFDMTILLNIAVCLAVFGFAWLYLRYRFAPLSYLVLMLGILMMHLTYAFSSPPHIVGAARYMGATFPFSELLGLKSESITRTRARQILIAFIVLLICAVQSFRFGILSWVS